MSNALMKAYFIDGIGGSVMKRKQYISILAAGILSISMLGQTVYSEEGFEDAATAAEETSYEESSYEEEAEAETVEVGVPSVLYSRFLNGVPRVFVAWLASFGLYS